MLVPPVYVFVPVSVRVLVPVAARLPLPLIPPLISESKKLLLPTVRVELQSKRSPERFIVCAVRLPLPENWSAYPLVSNRNASTVLGAATDTVVGLAPAKIPVSVLPGTPTDQLAPVLKSAPGPCQVVSTARAGDEIKLLAIRRHLPK